MGLHGMLTSWRFVATQVCQRHPVRFTGSCRPQSRSLSVLQPTSGYPRRPASSVHVPPQRTQLMSSDPNENHLPYFEPGSGYYGRTLGILNKNSVHMSQELVLSFLDTVPVTCPGVFTIGDYGTNDGYVSMSLFRNVIRHLRKVHGEELSVQVIYEDQEKNDFNSLFNRLSGEGSYLSEFSNVYAMATNSNFYKQCVPDSTFDVIFSSWSVHWLENKNFTFKDCIFNTSPEVTAEELQRFQQSSDRDWTKFLLLRARELKQGGLLVVLAPSSLDDFTVSVSKRGQTATSAGGSVFAIYMDLEQSWKQLRRESVITQQEYEKCTGKFAVRSTKEITSPFEAVGSPVKAAGLTLIHHDQIKAPCHLKSLWREKLHKEGVDDRQLFAGGLTAGMRVWSESTLRNSLSDMRSPEEKDAIIDHFYQVFNQRVAAVYPETYESEYITSRLVARKC